MVAKLHLQCIAGSVRLVATLLLVTHALSWDVMAVVGQQPVDSIRVLRDSDGSATLKPIVLRGILKLNTRVLFNFTVGEGTQSLWVGFGEQGKEVVLRDYFPDLDAVEVEHGGFRHLVVLSQTIVHSADIRKDNRHVLVPVGELSDLDLARESVRIRAQIRQLERKELNPTMNREAVALEIRRRAARDKKGEPRQ